MQRRLPVLSAVLVLLTAFSAFGQSITGRVTSAQDNSPLPGVSVVVKGTTIGTTTDAEGNYSIAIGNSANAVLSFSFIGFTQQEVAVGSRTTVDVALVDDISELTEVVVTAMGYEQDKGSLGYAVTKVKGEDMTTAGITQNPLTAMYGRAAGVQISQGAAGPTGGINIKVRGAASFNTTANLRPLFVVDGVIIRDQATSMESRGYDPLNSFDYGSGINDLNPADIESMEILSGAKASVLYGSQGANGVVLITTKKGKNTRGLGVQMSYQHTFEDPHSYIDFQNEFGSGTNQYSMDSVEVEGTKYRRLVASRFNFGPKFDGTPIRLFDGTTAPYQSYKDNFDQLFRNGKSDNFSLAIAGNSDFGNMRLAYSRDQYSGIMNNFERTRNTINVNGQIRASKAALFEVNTSLNSIKTMNRLPNIQDVVAWGFNNDYPVSMLKSYYLDSTGYRRNGQEIEDLGLAGTFVPRLFNVLWEQNQNRDIDTKTHLIGSVKSTVNINSWLSWVVFAGLDYTDTNFETKNSVSQVIPTIQGGRYRYTRTNSQAQTYNSFLNFDKSFVGDRLNVFAFAGGQYQRFTDNSIYAGTDESGLMFPGWYSLDNAKTWPSAANKGMVSNFTRGSNVLYSLMGSTTLSWDNEYYLELSGRNDWDSTLPPGNNSYFYPGAALTWKFSERFKIPYLQFGNLRASWADVGRGTSRYFLYNSYNVATLPNTNAISIQSPEDLFLGDLGKEYKPERKREIELGFNTRFFTGSRVEVDFSFYSNKVYNQIMAVPISSVSGGKNIRINAGELANHGYELMLKGTPVLTPRVKWDVTFTAARQQSEVVDLYPGINKVTLAASSNAGIGYLVVAEKGGRFGDIQMRDYLKAPDGQRVIGANGLYQLDDRELTTVGNVNPKAFGGMFSDVYYKGFNFHVGLDYKFGGTIVSYSNYYLKGAGLSESSLEFRDQAHGGIAYYITDSGERVRMDHNETAPAASADGRVYHDGLILPGVQQKTGVDGEITYAKNEQILSAYEYYSTLMHDTGEGFQPDNVYKNDYIKVRELSLSYTIPQSWVEKVKLQKVTVTAFARNLFYLYKTLPNLDAESALGGSSYYEYSFLPTVRSYGFGVNASF
ncbi:SusC/RagA family TonB-linked outer membrane protein [Parachryseolinea silvisoli]|uniref:SusC/RagA family TonB-linked outer membrane protein n=1 Tax=Parachryseolinea silvisoli TaxID=2873601 RepID=UPI002265B1C5|nr:SusC/RagA family TonB-linked outer membrane protein [Parachryseolinea silvisoli]MCD9019840.1 SusC/RagA family TonB-linked outer membrane protein [Parachryseolinea silvisoli]